MPAASTRCFRTTSWPGASCGSGGDITVERRSAHPDDPAGCTSSTCCRPSRRNTVDLDVGVPARGLHGEAYRGHIFWDELFIFPFLNFHIPEITRALLLYRYRRLPEARLTAQDEGHRGAMYPWQSGSERPRGEPGPAPQPALGPLDARQHLPAAPRQCGHRLQRLAVLRRPRATASSCRSTAPRCCSRSRGSGPASPSFNEQTGRYEIRGVMGPDEFHDAYPWRDEPGLDNNAYTNVMAAWVLRRALEVLQLLPARPARRARPPARPRPERAGDAGTRSAARCASRSTRTASSASSRATTRWRSSTGRLPRQVRRHPSPGPHPRGRGRQREPLQGVQAGRRADAVLPVLGRRAAATCSARWATPFDAETIPQTIDYYLPAHLARLDAEPGRPLLGAGAQRPGAVVAAVQRGAGQRRRGRPGRHHAPRASTSAPWPAPST